MYFFFFLWLSTSALLTLVAGLMKFYLALYCFFFLSFLALSEGLESWLEVGTEALALDLSL